MGAWGAERHSVPEPRGVNLVPRDGIRTVRHRNLQSQSREM
jgi:hypothetical protein